MIWKLDLSAAGWQSEEGARVRIVCVCPDCSAASLVHYYYWMLMWGCNTDSEPPVGRLKLVLASISEMAVKDQCFSLGLESSH